MNTPAITVSNPKVAAIGRGSGWIFEGWDYFMKAPGPWIAVMVLFFIVSMAMAFVPVIGGLALNILIPVFMAGLMLGCHAQSQGSPFTVNHLFAGFSSNHMTSLIVVGLLYFIGFVLITILVLIIIVILAGMSVGLAGLENLESLESGDPEFIRQNLKWLLLAVLLGAALYIPLLMSYWFAPALVVLGDVTPIEAMKMSFMGCLQNILPFTLYGVVGLVLCIIATIPLLLGFLVVGPMLTASVYIACREIFSP